MKNELIFVFTGPDGSGRKTVAKEVAKRIGMASVASYATREPRQGEEEGKPYRFVSYGEFLTLKNRGEFFETVEIDGNWYGIRSKDIIETLAENAAVYLIINPEGADILKFFHGDNVIRVFLSADKETVVARQKNRGDDEETIARHMAHYEEAMEYAEQCEYAFENADFEAVVSGIVEIAKSRGL